MTVHVPEEPVPQLHQRPVDGLGEGYLTLLCRVRDHVAHQRVYPDAHLLAEHRDRSLRQLVPGDNPGPKGVVDVVIHVRYPVGDAHDLALSGRRISLSCMVTYTVSTLLCQV